MRGSAFAIWCAFVLSLGACQGAEREVQSDTEGEQADATEDPQADDTDGEGGDDTEAQLRAIEDLRFDVAAMAELSFREYWADATQAQREECIRLLGAILENTIVRNHRLHPKTFQHLATEAIQGGYGVRVIQTTVDSSWSPREIVYALHLVQGEWLVVDVRPATTGALSQWHYDTLAQPHQHENVDALIDALRRRAEETAPRSPR